MKNEFSGHEKPKDQSNREVPSAVRCFPTNFERIVDHGPTQIFEGADDHKDIYARVFREPTPIAIQTSEKPIFGHYVSVTTQLKEGELSADDKLHIEAALPIELTDEEQSAAVRRLAEGSLQTLYAHFDQSATRVERPDNTFPKKVDYYYDATHALEVFEAIDANQAVTAHLKALPSAVHLWRGQALAEGHSVSVTARMRHSLATANHYVVVRTAIPEGLSEGERFMRIRRLAEGTLDTLYGHFAQSAS